MPYGILSCYCVLLVSCFVAIEAKIVYLNGTEIPDDNLKIVNATTKQPVQRWFSVFNPRNISNHSGTKTKVNLPTFNRKHDHDAQEEEKIEEAKIEENNTSSNNTLSTRDATVLSALRGQWRTSFGPIITLLSTLLGIFLILVIIESPLSPLPVPPLPYPPVGPFPPTNIYPFGVPPVRNSYDVHYAGPPTHGSYRIPRNLQVSNESEVIENMFEKVLQSIPDSLEDVFTTKANSWMEQLTHGFTSFFSNFRTMFENKSSQLLQEITKSSSEDQ